MGNKSGPIIDTASKAEALDKLLDDELGLIPKARDVSPPSEAMEIVAQSLGFAEINPKETDFAD